MLPENTHAKFSILDKMQGVAIELAKGIYEVDQILDIWSLTPAQFEAMLRHPRFTSLVQEAKAEWETADNTQKRTKLKAAVMLEQALPELNSRLHDRNESLSSKVELAKFLGRMADVDKGTGVAGQAETFKIEINLGAADNVKIEKQLLPRVIDAVPNEDYA